MSEETLHLVKVPLRADKLAAIARRRSIPLRDLDEGYLAHCLLRELWQDIAPAPFVLRGHGHAIDVWGYSHECGDTLVERARAFGDPSVLGAIQDLDSIASKQMPLLEKGKRVGFLLRACPVVRLAKGRQAGVSSVQVLDPASDKIVGEVPTGVSPHFVGYPRGSVFGLIVVQGPGELLLFDPTTNKPVRSVAVGKQPHWATTSSDGKTAYVTNEGSNDMTVVDLASGQTKSIAVGNAPRKVVVQPTKKTGS